jgi:hypothetical protein
MDPRNETPSVADVAAEANALSTGLGILTFTLFPWAVPGLVLVIGPLLLLAVPVLLLAGVVLLPVWLARVARALIRRRHEPHRRTRIAVPSRAARSS